MPAEPHGPRTIRMTPRRATKAAPVAVCADAASVPTEKYTATAAKSTASWANSLLRRAKATKATPNATRNWTTAAEAGLSQTRILSSP